MTFGISEMSILFELYLVVVSVCGLDGGYCPLGSESYVLFRYVEISGRRRFFHQAMQLLVRLHDRHTRPYRSMYGTTL
jgi:hypothetical protein